MCIRDSFHGREKVSDQYQHTYIYACMHTSVYKRMYTHALTHPLSCAHTQTHSYRVPGFLATSFSRDVAERFIFNNCYATALRKPAVLWKVHVDPEGERQPGKLCKHVNYVANTHVPGEQEYLFTAYSVFTIRRVTWSVDFLATPHEIDLDAALDNREHSLDLQLAPWY